MCEYCDENKNEYLSKRRDDIYGKKSLLPLENWGLAK